MENLKSINDLINQYKNANYTNSNLNFKDILFPPTDESIFSKNDLYRKRTFQKPQSFFPLENDFSKCQYDSLQKTTKYKWNHISKILNDYNIIKNPRISLSQDDIIPGDLGNCYFFSALKFLMEEPERITSLIDYSLPLKKIDYFKVYIYLNGYKSTLILDKYFPCINQNNLIFSKYNPKTKNIWPMILEKAWAKVNSSYEDTIDGNISDIFLFLTPCPIKLYHHDIKYNDIFEKICYAIDHKYIVCCDINSKNDNILLKKLGVISNHAYKIIGYGTILDSEGKKSNLIKIHNDYQITSWIGKWSPYSSIWTTEYKKHLNYNPEDPSEKNNYYMEINDYLKFYTTTYILYWHKNYNYFSRKIYIKGINEPFTCCKIVFNKIKQNINDKKIIFLLNTKNKRIIKNYKKKINYSDIFKNFSVYKMDNEKKSLKLIDSKCGKDERIFIEINNDQIKEGDIFIIAVSFPYLNNEKYILNKNFSINPKRPKSFCVGIYTNAIIEEKNLIIDEYIGNKEKMENNLLKSIYEKSKLNTHLYYFEKENEYNTSRSINFENQDGAYGYLILENNSKGILYENFVLCEYNNVNIIYYIHKSKYNIKDNDENLIEDKNIRKFYDLLNKKKYKSEFEESKIEILDKPKKNEELPSEKNPYELLIKVGIKSTIILIFEKCDEYASIDIRSQIIFKYPLYIIINEMKSKIKHMNRLEYQGNKIEIYEYIIESSTGIVFYYKNKENNYIAKIKIKFVNLQNLIIGLNSDIIEYDENSNNILFNKNDGYINLIVPSGKHVFFELKTQNIFQSFNYNFDVKYEIVFNNNTIKNY